MNYTSNRLLTGVLCILALLELHPLLAQVNRSYDGSGNNLSHLEWGAVGQHMTRWADPCYADSIAAPAGADRLSPRIISNELFNQPLPLVDPMGLSDYCWVFGQFIDHDITLALDGPEFLFIPVPLGDTLFDPQNTGASLIPMHRSLAAPNTGTSTSNPRQHANAITAFIDGSMVYGSSQARADWLRTFTGGKLKTSPGNYLPYNTLDGTLATDVDPQAPHMDNPLPFYEKVFVAGDVRANENPLLATLHTLFVREHNRLCDVLIARDPTSTDEELYQRARKLNGAILQSIVYNEWLPAMGVELPTYTGYDPQVNPAVRNEFSAAAFRMGHTLLNGQLRRLNPDGSVHPLGHLSLRDAYFNPTALDATGGLDPFVKGMAEQTQQTFDAHVIDDVRNFLFGRPGRGGLDLAAININRGRERGLPDFNAMRVALGLAPVATWSDINSNPAIQDALTSVYPSVDSIDAWVGMLAEDAMADKLFGPTVNEAMMQQFAALRDGDRYFYLNDSALSTEDCGIVGSTRLSDVLRRNTDVEIMQSNVFTSMLHDSVPACLATTSTADLTVSVALPNGAALPGATVRVYGMDDVMPQATTDQNGEALLAALPTCDDYAADAVVVSDPAAGITGYDMYLIGQHILGNQPLTDTYTLLAADVNRSGSISGFDLSNMRRVILGYDQDFRGESPWRIINPAVLPGPGDDVLTFDYEHKVHLERFATASTQTLVALKMGDVDASFSPLAPRLQPRSTSTLALSLQADGFGASLTPTDDQLVATDYRLMLPSDTYITSVAGLSDAQYRLSDDGRVLHVLDVKFEQELAQVQLAFAKPVRDASSLTLDAEALGYTASGTPRTLVLEQTAVAPTEVVEVKAFPNPFTTQLEFEVPREYTDGAHQLVLTDATGRVLHRLTLTEQRLVLHRNQLDLPSGAQITWSVESEQQVLVSGIVQLVAQP